MKQNLALTLVSALAIAPAAAEIHFGAGVAYYDDNIVHYNDKTYRDNFSWDIGLYSDFDKSHMVFLDAHLYAPIVNPVAGLRTYTYAGIGGLYLRDKDNYVHEMNVNEYEESWGIRFPIGVEAIHASDISIFAEVVPTYIVDPDTKYEMAFTFGMRYYFF